MALSSREILLILRARDEATRVIGRVSSAMSTMDRNAATSSARIVEEQKGVLRGLQSQLGDVNTQYSRTLNEAYAMHRQQQNATNEGLAMVRGMVREVNDEYTKQARILQDRRRSGQLDAQMYSAQLQDANRLRQDQLRYLTNERVAIQDTSRASHAAYNQQLSDARATHIGQQESIRLAKEEAQAIIRQHQDIDGAARQQRAMSRANAEIMVGYGAAAMATGASMIYFGAQGVRAFMDITQASIDYEQAARKTLTQTDTVKASLEDIKQMGKEIADTVPVAFEEIQPAMYDVFSSIDVNMRQAKTLTKQFAKDAVAGQTQMSVATRANLLIMNAYKLETKDAAKVSDFMFQLVRKGVGTYDEFATTIGRAIPSARRAGQSYQTLGAMMAFLTRNGLSAAMAATASGRALDAISNSKTVDKLEDMGISVKNMQGEFKPLPDILDQMDKKFSKLTSPERSKALQELFKGSGGTIQARRFFDNYFKNADEFNQRTKEMANVAGAAGEAFKTMADSPQAKIQQLKNDWMLLRIEMGENLMPILMTLVGHINDLVDWFKNLSPETQTMIGKAALLATGLTILIGVLVAASGAVMVLTGGMKLMAGAAATTAGKFGMVGAGLTVLTGGMAAASVESSRASQAMGILASAGGGALMGFAVGGPIGAAIGGGAGALMGLYQATKSAKSGMEEAKQPVLNYIETLDQLTGRLTETTRQMAMQKLVQDDLIGSAASIGISARTMIDAALGQKDAIKAVNEAYKGQKDIVGALQGGKLLEWIKTQTGDLAGAKRAWELNHVATASYRDLLKELPKNVRIEVKQAGAEPSAKQIRNLMADADQLTKKERKVLIELLGGPAVVREAQNIKNNLDKIDKTKPNMDPLMNGIANGVEQAAKDAGLGSRKIQKLLQDSTKVTPNFTQYTNGINAGGTASLDDALSAGYGVGNSLKQGTINGFAGTGDILAQQAAAAVNKAEAAARAAADSHSPSRKFYAIGKDLADGMYLGWKANEKPIQDAPSKLVQKLVKELLQNMGTEMPRMSILMDQARDLIEKKFDKKREAIEKGGKKANEALKRFDNSRDKKEKTLLSGIVEATEKDFKKLQEVVGKYQAKVKDFEAANDELKRLRDEKASYISSLSSSLAQIGNISDIKGQEIMEESTDFYGNTTSKGTGQYKPPTIGDIVSGLQSKLQRLRDFGAAITALRNMGYSAAVLNQVLQMGPTDGLAYAQALQQATPDQMAAVNAADAGITSLAATLATEAGAHMYDVGIAIQQGIVDGLAADMETLRTTAETLGAKIEQGMLDVLGGKEKPGDKQGRMVGDGIATGLHSKADAVAAGARHLAWAIVNNFEDVLKIHSPSKVGINLGRNFGGSVGMGLMREASTVESASKYLASQVPFDVNTANPKVGINQPGYSGPQNQVNQEINITTQELDPQRHAAMLGWELASRGF